jgi:hypothetical protein
MIATEPSLRNVGFFPFFDRRGLDRKTASGNAVNPSMEAAAKTSRF